MLRILDARTGESVPATPARRGLTRVEAHAGGLDLTALRVLLTADLLVRALELGGTPVWTMLTAPREQAELGTAGTVLSIRPFEDSRDVASGLGEAQVVHVRAAAEEPPAAGVVVAVAAAGWDGGGEDVQELLTDPGALRLALLSVPRDEPAALDAGALEEAARTAAAWRTGVARWANQPSRPVPDEVRARLRAAWEDDLDLPGVLAVLRDVASAPDLPDGARFETFLYADRLLALDLAGELGNPG
ncbi:hypothetical protein EV284_3346 [Streptomyces sp. BK022]|uniref:hypothetical protein n=1 Tax=Streptomyces sp. BK022 TaxID=2512123 RepID=UPI0010296E0C|nr:hypothetical protein [Streptomyces sp. BK022]RZU35863.1 hypothetical protein EV284_3346 [Streptomyces sp. BK022]